MKKSILIVCIIVLGCKPSKINDKKDLGHYIGTYTKTVNNRSPADRSIRTVNLKELTIQKDSTFILTDSVKIYTDVTLHESFGWSKGNWIANNKGVYLVSKPDFLELNIKEARNTSSMNSIVLNVSLNDPWGDFNKSDFDYFICNSEDKCHKFNSNFSILDYSSSTFYIKVKANKENILYWIYNTKELRSDIHTLRNKNPSLIIDIELKREHFSFVNFGKEPIKLLNNDRLKLRGNKFSRANNTSD